VVRMVNIIGVCTTNSASIEEKMQMSIEEKMQMILFCLHRREDANEEEGREEREEGDKKRDREIT